MKRPFKRLLGKTFLDELVKLSHPHGHFAKMTDTSWQELLTFDLSQNSEEVRFQVWRGVLITSLIIIAFSILFIRLFHLQLTQGAYNRTLADSNRIQIRTVHAPRGVIYDRAGKVLADSNPGFRLKGKFILREEALKMEAQNDPSLLELEVDNIRSYKNGAVFAHILGYVGEISQEELRLGKYQNYRLGDQVGRGGVEAAFEKELKGKDGAEIIEVDSSGKKIRVLRRIDSIPGNNIFLGVDEKLQEKAFSLLSTQLTKVGSCCGVVITEDLKTGEILSMVSLPTFDANAFSDPKRQDKVESFFTKPHSPLLNRAIAGTYPPGSTFKISTALAGLSSGKITADTQIEDTGVIYLGNTPFANWYFSEYGKTEGLVNIRKALQRSNDIYFYKVGELVGDKYLAEVAKKIGFGKKVGVDIPGEVDGLVPDGKWKQKNLGQLWYPGDLLHMAIGQGYLLVTPIQVLAQIAFIADDGKLISPHLVSKITDPQGNLVKQFRYEPIVKDYFKKEDVALVKNALSLVPKVGGTAWPFFSFSLPSAGKTGTAEFGDPQGRTHAWYTSFAPVEDPKIATTVLVEAGGEGSNVSAPITKEVYRWYFSADKNKLIQDVYTQATESATLLGE